MTLTDIDQNSRWFMNGHVTIHLPQADNADGISIIEHLLPNGFGPPLHVHHDEDETFYVLQGQLRYKLGDRVLQAGAGESVYLPKAVPHGFRVVSADGARCLTVTRGGFENMVRSASVPAPTPVLPEQVEPSPEMQARLTSLCAQNGIELLGPPID